MSNQQMVFLLIHYLFLFLFIFFFTKIELPEYASNNGAKIVIVNLQKTPIDELADLRIFAKCDEVFTKIFSQMQYKVPIFKRATQLYFSCKLDENKTFQWKIDSWDGNRTPFFSFVSFSVPAFNNFVDNCKSQPFSSSFSFTPEFNEVSFDFVITFGLFGKEEKDYILVRNSFLPDNSFSFSFSFSFSLVVNYIDYNLSLPVKIENPISKCESSNSKKDRKRRKK
jgi:hypothetical protein